MSNLLCFHKRILFFISVCFFLSQSLQASEFLAWKFDLPEDYPYAQIIIQKKPKSTLTLVYADSALLKYKADSIKRKFQSFLRKHSHFDGYITQDLDDHNAIEHFGCDEPYVNHAHIAFKVPLTLDALSKILTVLELGYYKREILHSFQEFFEPRQERKHEDLDFQDFRRFSESFLSLVFLQNLMHPSI